jgi:hypothetical protein
MRQILTTAAAIGMFVALPLAQAIAADQAPITKPPKATSPPTDTTPPPTGGTSARPSGQPGTTTKPTGVQPPVIAVPASIQLNCGGKKYNLSTGTNKGECKIEYDEKGRPTQGTCVSGDGSAWATCAAGCTNTKGAGDCKAAQ